MDDGSFMDKKKLEKYHELWSKAYPGMSGLDVHRRWDKNARESNEKNCKKK